ncbi:30S ribosome-binding factor RbfA [Thermodesulfobacteriota bacterium]
MNYKRADRVADLIKREISRLLIKGLKDPRFEWVTITGVDLSEDLKHAKVYYTAKTGKEADLERVSRAFESAKGFIRNRLGRETNLRYVPELMFRVDESFDYAKHIEGLLKKAHDDEGQDRVDRGGDQE